MLSELKPMSIIFRAEFSQGHRFPLPHQPQSSPQINSSTKNVHSGRKWVWKPSTYPRVGDPSLGVFKGREEPYGQVVSHVQQLVVIILNRHVAKGLLGVGYYSVGREKAPQDPKDRKNKRIIKIMLAVQNPVQNDGSKLESSMDLALPESEGLNLPAPWHSFWPLAGNNQLPAKHTIEGEKAIRLSESTKNNPLLVITVFGHRHHLITRQRPHHMTF